MPPEAIPEREARLTRFGGMLILIAGAAHVLIGLAALAGASGFEANVLEIESNKDFGSLYLSLQAWGAILLVLGAGEMLAASRLLRGRPNGRLAALLVAFVGLAGAFASLAIFRWAALATIPVLLLGIFVLSRYERG